MIRNLLKNAKAGQNVFITDVRETFETLPVESRDTLIYVLDMVSGEPSRLFELRIPIYAQLNDEEANFVKSYLWAETYNFLSCLGGKKITVYVDTARKELVSLAQGLNDRFDIDKSLADRRGYGRCVNVIDRMMKAICPDDPEFCFEVKDISEKPEIIETAGAGGGSEIFKRVSEEIAGKVICGLDIGGTDIKAAMAVDGKLTGLKEYDWFPEKYSWAKELIDPICILVRLMKAQVSLDSATKITADEKAALEKELDQAMDKDASYQLILKVTEQIEAAVKDELIEIDAVGLCFPDVVVKDKVVGGEVTKTRGMRNNPKANYEEEFARITNLDKDLLVLCKPGGVVKDTNDGPMASFTAAVEIAASGQVLKIKNGVFAHTLGTELGTGWVDSHGKIPEIPLEVYNFIIDLGSFHEKAFPADDVRSINNFNTDLAGTLQRYTSQSGVFRLGMKYFHKQRPELYQELFDKGLVVEVEADGKKMITVPTKPKDMRKVFLEHMMELVEREPDGPAQEIFRQVGEFLAITWFETQRILQPTSKSRTLFGRLVKRNSCFELICQGAHRRIDNLQMDVADGGIANTSLMKQLQNDKHFTVAQFAQAVGAIYYGNMGLLQK